jgi:hypothetical protein
MVEFRATPVSVRFFFFVRLAEKSFYATTKSVTGEHLINCYSALFQSHDRSFII